MKKEKIIIISLALLFFVVLVWGGYFVWDNFSGAGPATTSPPRDIAELLPGPEGDGTPPSFPGQNMTDFPLDLPDNFSISVFADNLPGARVMVFDSMGNMWISQTSQGIVSLVSLEDGRVSSQDAILRGLNRPHGLAFDPEDPLMLYFAEEDKISRVRAYSEDRPEKIFDLPSGAGHFTRTLLFAPDGRLWVSIGSSCNVCEESDSRRSSIISMNKDGSDARTVAEGLRNAVFMETDPVTEKVWATEMGRDLLGDNTPPDEINIIEPGRHYGWPYCYGKQIFDGNFGRREAEFCLDQTVGSHIDIQAHSAPLGLAFVPEDGWPEEYASDLLVAYHGSWNRTVPTGYKLVRFELDDQRNLVGTHDFITGWLTADGALGRPADIVARPGGIVYVSDDHAGVIYKISYRSGLENSDSGGENSGCKITGCSGQICSSEDVITTCEFLPEYGCYRDATCERQSDGQCGWTMTDSLRDCLGDAVGSAGVL